MVAVWHPISASVCKTGEVTTVLVVSGWRLQRPLARPSLQGHRCTGPQGNYP